MSSEWRRSSKCGTNTCVEVRKGEDDFIDFIEVRASSIPAEILYFTREEWDSFTAGVRAGEFDNL